VSFGSLNKNETQLKDVYFILSGNKIFKCSLDYFGSLHFKRPGWIFNFHGMVYEKRIMLTKGKKYEMKGFCGKTDYTACRETELTFKA
jgi:hypothetical protein